MIGRAGAKVEIYAGQVADRAAVFLYDGDCGFCTVSAQWLVRRVHPDVPVRPWQGEPADLTAPITEQLARSVVLLDLDRTDGHRGDVRATAAAAIAAILRTSPHRWARLTGRLMTWPLARHATELGYRVVAANRHRLPGSTAACAVDARPTGT